MFALPSFKYRTPLPSRIIASFSLRGCCNIRGFHSMKTAILFQDSLHISCPLQAKNSRFEFFVYELTVGDRFGSSRAYEPSSFLRIRYTINMTTKMAQRRPTTAPPITAATCYKRISTTIQIRYTTDTQQVLHNKRFSAFNSPTPKCVHAQTDGWADGWTDRHLQD